MRDFVTCSLGLVSFAVILSGQLLAQPVEELEEIVVRAKPLHRYRAEIEVARDEMIRLFNEANEGDDNDVRCRYDAPTGTRIPVRVCFSAAQDRASAGAARDLLTRMGFGSGHNLLSGAAHDSADGESRAMVTFEKEWRRVMGTNQQFYEAAVKYGELEAEFRRLNGRTSASVQQPQQPRQVLLGPAGPQCEASTLTEYQQRNNVASVSGTVSISACPAGTTGSFTLVANVRDEAGAVTPIEFNETWQRADAQDHIFNSDHPIGENVFLQSVRVRNLTCTCVDPSQ